MPGRVLTLALPYELVGQFGSDGVLRISHPAGRSLAGRLTFPYVPDEGGGFGLADLDVPSSGNFSQADLRALWDAGRQLATWDVRTAVAMIDGSGYAVPEIVGADAVLKNWRALASCARYAAGMLTHWPTSLERDVAWHAVGVPAGTEDLLATEREAEHRAGLYRRDGRFSVERSARSVGRPRRWTSGAVSAIAQRVLALASATAPDDLDALRPALAPIAEVARLAEPPPGVTDPDASSWPPAFIGFVAAALPAVAELTSRARGDGAVPLLDTDELFESWLAGQVVARLSARFGAPTHVEAGVVRWQESSPTIELRIKPVVSKGRPLTGGGKSFFAVGADRLVPDLLLVVHDDVTVSLAVLDAKAWTSMQAEQALSESAKYLYGIRSTTEGEQSLVPVLHSVTLVTSALAPVLTEAVLARLDVVTAVPTSSPALLNSLVNRLLTDMVGAV